MDEEIQPGPARLKAVPLYRDCLQSQLLVSIVGSLLLVLCLSAIRSAAPFAARFPAFVFGGAAVSLTFAAAVWSLRAATSAAAAMGGLICLLSIYLTGSFDGSLGRTALTPLAALFVLTFLATRAGRKKKARVGLAEGRRGRTASQVIANLSTAVLCVNPFVDAAIGRWMPICCVSGTANIWIMRTMKLMCLAALAEATADTVSSEIGQAFGGPPRMLFTWQRVEPGTDGAVTTLGTLAGVAAGALVALSGAWAMRLHSRETIVAIAAGTAGLFFDSLLGATVERKGWLGNDLVNFASTAFAALLAAILYRYGLLR